jgi:hypothetical protein
LTVRASSEITSDKPPSKNCHRRLPYRVQTANDFLQEEPPRCAGYGDGTRRMDPCELILNGSTLTNRTTAPLSGE